MAAGTKIVFDAGDQISGTDETASTLTVRAATSGASSTGARRGKPIFGAGPGPLKIVTGQISLDSNYPTGGEDIAEIWRHFKVKTRNNSRVATDWYLLGICLDESVPNAAGKGVVIDYSNKLLKVITAFAGTEAANNSDQSALAAMRFLAWGLGS